MSDEEKKAIIELKHYCNLTQYWKNIEYTKPEFDDYVKTILNLIEKQSKEIEELKAYKHDAELTKIACCTAQNCEALNNCIKLGRELQNADKKWEDKIKAKIKEIEKLKTDDENSIINRIVNWFINQMQSLLEKE